MQSRTRPDGTFCVYGFTHLNIRTDGKASLCCRALDTITNNDRDLSLHTDTFDEIWNAPYMRDVRRRMISGEPVAACSGCYSVEREGGKSLRSHANSVGNLATLLPGKDLTAAFDQGAKIVHESQGVAPAPSSLHLWLGNLCNLKCRMCSANYSSQIAGDAIHSKWSGVVERSVLLLPEFLQGVDYRGFGELRHHRGREHRMIGARQTALIAMPSHGNPISRIEIAGFKGDTLPCTIVVMIGNEDVFTKTVKDAEWQFDIGFQPPKDHLSQLTLGLRYEDSEAIVGIRSLVVRGAPPLGKEFPPEFVSRLPENPAWYANGEVILNEIMAHPENLRFINFAGGEPMLNPHLEAILALFVDRGLGKNVGLHFSTNGTIKSLKVLSLLKQFAYVGLGVSVDGVGVLHEYIRHPARWNIVLDNMRRYNEALPWSVSAQPTPQAYNFYGLLDLAKFCDTNGFTFTLNNVLHGPRYLSFEILPESIINEGIVEWETYRRSSCRPELVAEVDTIIGALQQPRPADIGRLQEDFIRFTNDLDKSRSQSFAQANPRLYQRLVEEGFRFENKFRYS
jgi:glutamate-1-semialdehyde 2,1-aminomutase